MLLGWSESARAREGVESERGGGERSGESGDEEMRRERSADERRCSLFP